MTEGFPAGGRICLNTPMITLEAPVKVIASPDDPADAKQTSMEFCSEQQRGCQQSSAFNLVCILLRAHMLGHAFQVAWDATRPEWGCQLFSGSLLLDKITVSMVSLLHMKQR